VNFIEGYLDFSPDGADGSFELMLLMMLVMMTAGMALGYFAVRDESN